MVRPRAGPSGEKKTPLQRLRKFLSGPRMVEVEIVVVYLFVGIVFYSQTEGKTCESEECESNCVRRDGESDDELIERVALINPYRIRASLNETGVLVCEERWTVIDALYFCMVTVSTVGYGDFYPQTVLSMIFTVVYMMFSAPVLMAMADLSMKGGSVFFEKVEELRKRKWPEAPKSTDEEDTDAAHLELQLKSTVASTRWHFFVKRLLPYMFFSMFRFILVNLLIALIYFYLQPAWLDYHLETYGPNPNFGTTSAYILCYFACVWHCAVTATTVGYNSGPVETPGFQEPGAQGARLFCTFHLLFAVSYYSILIDTVMTMFKTHKADISEARMLQREADPELIATLDQDGDGVSKLEYVCGMLQLLEAVDPNLIRRLQKRFDQLDTSGDGLLTEEDLTRSAEEMRSKLMEWREENAQASFIQETGMRISQVSDRWRRSSEVWRRDSWRESTRESTRDTKRAPSFRDVVAAAASESAADKDKGKI